MNRYVNRMEAGRVGKQAVLNVRPIALAISTMLVATVPAHAQQSVGSASTPSTTVVVTGIARSIETSVATKRDSDSIVEVVSAEDLGKLPDISIAESIARLPGIAAQRVDGRAQVISIRGLAPKYGVTLLNGRELASTGDSRSVEYDQFPSELINGVTVYKTPDAALGTQGLAGTVNMKTVNPLDFRGRQGNINVRAESNSNDTLVPGVSGKGMRLSASYVDQFANNTIGLALGFAHLDSPGQQKYFKSWWWGNSAIWWGGFRGLENEDPSKAAHVLQGFDSGVTSTETVRNGAMAVLEYKPNKDFHSKLDLYYSKFDQEAAGREFQANLMPDWSGNGTSGAPVSGGPIYSNVGTKLVKGDPYAVTGAISNVDPFALIRYNKREDEIFAFGWNNELKIGKWTALADLSYSKAERDEIVGELTMSAPSVSGFSSFYAETGNGLSRYTPSANFGDATAIRLRSINDWGSMNGAGQAGSSSPIKVADDAKSLRLSARREFEGLFSSFEGGIQYSERDKDVKRTQTMYTLANGVSCVNSRDTCAAIPAGILQSPVSLAFIGVPKLVSFDFMDAVNSGAYNSGTSNASSAPGRIWDVSEQVTTFFAKVGFEFQAGIPFRGNIGLQVVSADQDSHGLAWDSKNNVAVPISGGSSYTDTLPSLNLIGEVGRNAYVRLGWARVMARPEMEQMRAGFSGITVATTGPKAGMWSANGGNPGLEPWRADAMDISIEKYFGKRSYVAFAAFRKDLKSSVYTDTISYDFTGFPNPTNMTPISNIGELSAPTNGTGGFIKGVELAAAVEGAMLSPMLDGFGMIVSESKTSSNVPGSKSEAGSNLRKPIEGMSGDVTSLIGYYEKNGFQFRVAQRYRSQFRAQVRGVWIDTSVATIEPEKITDLQFGYSFETGSLKGLSFLFQINNVDDTPYRTKTQDDSSNATPMAMLPEKYYTYGRQYLLGVNYKF